MDTAIGSRALTNRSACVRPEGRGLKVACTDSRIQMNPSTASHQLLGVLERAGIDRVFLVPGESYLAVLDGFHQHRDRIRFIACRQEGGATFMDPMERKAKLKLN